MLKKNIYPQWFLIVPLALYVLFFLAPGILGVLYSFTDECPSIEGIHFTDWRTILRFLTSTELFLRES